MFRFIRTKGPSTNLERQKLQKELFSYKRTLQHGFPHKPTAIAWDPSLRLLCLGTASGAIKVFGRPGVEFYGQHQTPIAVTQIVFLHNQGRVVSLCDDNSLHLWEVNKSSLVEVKSQALEGKLKKISTMCVESSGKHLLLGTEGGNIYLLDLASFTMTPDIIYQDVVMQNVPQDYKLNPGAVESIFEQPDQPDNILIGYNRGLIVLWNRNNNTAVKTFTSTQQLESLCWHEDGKSFTSSHNDGSYMVWDIEVEKPNPEPKSIYGPFACRAIHKIIRRELKEKPLIVFSGGLSRSTYSDKYTVSVIHDEEHVCFDFTSKIIDFLVIDERLNTEDGTENGLSNGTSTRGEPEALVVLADEELVVIDLQCKEWKMIDLPYLVSLHASAVTCSQYVSEVPEELWEQLKDAGKAQQGHLYSSRPWPIDGGALLCAKGSTARRELLLTGHEDGTVRFWDAGGVTLTPVYKFSTAQYFNGDELDEISPEVEDPEQEWPPFRKTGVFDPYSDDPRLAVKRTVLCPLSGTLVVAGTAGHLVVAKFDTETLEAPLQVTQMNIVSDRDSFVWKGHKELTVRAGDIRQSRGFQASSVLQLHPPAAVTCCALHADWGLVAAGTAHGLALFDYVRNKAVMTKCTLNPNDLTGAGDTPISRRKSFKKSLRESFRRLRKGRSTRRAGAGQQTPANSPPQPGKKGETGDETKPVERQVEARTNDDGMGSFVRCLYFARTFLVNVHNTTPTLWAGTASGVVHAFTLTVPATGKRTTEAVQCHAAKEITLKHRAPVIAVAVLDGQHRPLPEPLEVEKGTAPLPDTTQPHTVVIASEEQFKVFTLPGLKAVRKYKLTAHEGARVRRMAFANFSCISPETDAQYSEVDLLCLTNLGDCLVLSIPDLKRQLNAAAIRREDINGISSLVFTKEAEALYLHSSSELQRISLSSKTTSPRCYLPLPQGARDDALSDTSENERQVEGETSLTNGVEGKDDSVSEKHNEAQQNGSVDDPHNVTVSSSVGDITLDSVKDHLGSGEELNLRLSNLSVTKTQVTITPTTATTAVVQEGVAGNSESPTPAAVAGGEQGTQEAAGDIIQSSPRGPTPTFEIKKIQVSDLLLHAPLAMEEDDRGLHTVAHN